MRLPSFVNPPGPESAKPGLMSANSFVPFLVPSVTQSSLPLLTWYAEKNMRLPSLVMSPGNEPTAPSLRSANSFVPFFLPFVTQSSLP